MLPEGPETLAVLLIDGCVQCKGHPTDCRETLLQALASQRLEEAQKLLESAAAPPLAPKLQTDVKIALADLRPACVLDKLQVAWLLCGTVVTSPRCSVLDCIRHESAPFCPPVC